MSWIQLSNGMYTEVDQDDAIWLLNYSWSYHNHGYAYTKIKTKTTLMHTMIGEKMGFIKSPDHIDRNKLNNKRENLREATDSQNKMNKNKQSNNTSGYPGISWYKQTNRWRAYLQFEGKFINLGYYHT